MASILEVCKNGCDYVDTAVAPLAWGTGHADILAVQSHAERRRLQVKEVNMAAYMEVRSQIQEMMDDFLGLYCNRSTASTTRCSLRRDCRAGMMGSLMADLKPTWNRSTNGKPSMGNRPSRKTELLHQAVRRSGLHLAQSGLSLPW